MTPDEVPFTPDALYHAIASLRGWSIPLSLYDTHGRDQAWRVGRLVSSILVAADDNREPLAVSGSADDDGTGSIVVVYPGFLVIADVRNLDVNTGEFTVSVHALSRVTNLRVSTRHNYYSGTTTHPRHKGIEVGFAVDGAELSLIPNQVAPYGAETLTGDGAIYRAFVAIREAVSGRTST